MSIRTIISVVSNVFFCVNTDHNSPDSKGEKKRQIIQNKIMYKLIRIADI